MSREKIEYSRPPTVEDLVNLCRSLNDEGVQYIVIGGLAIIAQGFTRATEDIDLLIKDDLKNHQKLIKVLSKLPDGAASELSPADISEFEVIRVADEFVVDLMTRACGEKFEGNQHLIEKKIIEGVSIPFASSELLLKLKQGVRPKDKMDRDFLEKKLLKKN